MKKTQSTLDSMIKSVPKKSKTPKAASKAESKKEIEEEEEKKAPTELKPITPASDPFPDYDDWIDELGDWKEPLADVLKKSLMRDVY